MTASMKKEETPRQAMKAVLKELDGAHTMVLTAAGFILTSVRDQTNLVQDLIDAVRCIQNAHQALNHVLESNNCEFEQKNGGWKCKKHKILMSGQDKPRFCLFILGS